MQRQPPLPDLLGSAHAVRTKVREQSILAGRGGCWRWLFRLLVACWQARTLAGIGPVSCVDPAVPIHPPTQTFISLLSVPPTHDPSPQGPTLQCMYLYYTLNLAY